MKAKYWKITVAAFAIAVVASFAAYAGRYAGGTDEDEQTVSIDQVPPAVKVTLQKEAAGGTIKEIELGQENGKIVYEADVVVNGRETEIRVADDGTLQSRQADDEDENEQEENEEDQTVSLDQVPAAVKATLVKEAAGGVIKEIGLDDENGKVGYEADVIIDGQKTEIKIAGDGTLLSKQADDEDENEEDGQEED